MMADDRNKPDKDQSAAIGADRNTVVTAGAGSGKTRVLAERFYRLVAEGKAEVDRILTLTFTRKAAAEMHRRIYDLLRSRGDNDFVRKAVEDFSSARISTLDAFSASILRGTAASYGVPPSFQLDDDGARERAARLSLSFVLENQDRPSLRGLVKNQGLEAVLRGFTELAVNKLPVGRSLDFPAMGRRQDAFLQRSLEEGARALEAVVAKILQLSPSPGKASARAAVIRSAQEALAGFTGPVVDAEGGVERLEAVLAVIGGLKKPGGAVTDPEVQIYKDCLDTARKSLGSLTTLLETRAHRPLARDLFLLLEDFHVQVDRMKRSSGVLSFGDCAELAVRSLEEDPALRSHYKKRFRYIMIDEFQDNNSLQKNLLYLLAERDDRCSPGIPDPADLAPEKLFFVGDEKQSIYRFRGADVRVFKSLEEELSRQGGSGRRLGYNYRSDPGLIDFFNTLFSRVMEGAAADHEARFEGMSPNPERAGRSEGTISIFCKPYSPDRPPGLLDNDSAEAYHLARAISHWVRNESLMLRDGKTGASRPAGYGDFAVLMRSTSGQMRYERMFRLFGVPYTTSGIRSLFLEAPVNDFYAALQTAVHPWDRTAYATFLRSPLVGLSDDFLMELLPLNLPPFRTDGLTPPPAEEEKLRRGEELYRWIREAADSVTVPALLSHLWHRGGYRFFLLRDPALHPFLELYDYLREFALLVPGETLAAFLDRLRPNLGNHERIPELEVLRDDAQGVKIMTVHRAKGLEFPVVALVNSGNVGRPRREGDDLFRWSDEHGLSCAWGSRRGKHDYFHAVGEEEEAAREDAERKRLLYVACTRAENHLLISGCFTRNNRGSDKAFLTMIFRALGLDPDNPDPSASPWELRFIPDVPVEVLYRQGDAARSPATAAAVYTPPPLLRSCPRREYSVTELAALLGGPGRPETEKETEKETGAGRPAPRPETAPVRPGPEQSGIGSDGAGAAGAAAGDGGDPDQDLWFGSLCHRVVEQVLRRRLADAGREGPGAQERPREGFLLRRAEEEAVRAGRPLRGECPRPESYEAFLEEALGLAAGFFASPLAEDLFARAAAAGVPPEPEVPFIAKPWQGGPLVNGVMDLVFPLPEETVVVDFKTDRVEAPEAHRFQMAVYRTAAEEIWGRPARAWLYYLRSGGTVRCREPLPAWDSGAQGGET